MRCLLFLVVSVSCAWAQGAARGPLVISAEEVAAAFGYKGKLVAEDFTAEGKSRPGLVQALNFTARDLTFLPATIVVSTAGSVITPAKRAEWEKAPDESKHWVLGFRRRLLADGTMVFLFETEAGGGIGGSAWLTSKDGRFDLSVKVVRPGGGEHKGSAGEGAYNEAMFGRSSTGALDSVEGAVARIYPIVAANYAKVAKDVVERGKEPTGIGPAQGSSLFEVKAVPVPGEAANEGATPTPVPGAVDGAPGGVKIAEQRMADLTDLDREAQLTEIDDLSSKLEERLATLRKALAEAYKLRAKGTNTIQICASLEATMAQANEEMAALKARRDGLREEIKKSSAGGPGSAGAGSAQGALVPSPAGSPSASPRAFNGAVEEKSRIPEIKVLRIVDDKTVYVRTNHIGLSLILEDGAEVANEGKRLSEELTFSVGQNCHIGGFNKVQSLTLMKVENGRAVFHFKELVNQWRKVLLDEVISVAPYEAGFWKVDSTDSRRVTYTEFNEQGMKKMEKNYKNDQLDGLWITWYDNGQKASEMEYKNNQANGPVTEWYPSGQKRHEGTNKDGRSVGKETYWRPDGYRSSYSE